MRVQVISDLFLVLPKMAVLVMYLHAHPIMIAEPAFVATTSVQLLVEIKTIALMVNIVRIIDA